MGRELDDLIQAVLDRMGTTWTPDDSYMRNVRNAVEDACTLLRAHSGNPGLPLHHGEFRDLCVTCAIYLVYKKRAEFLQDYGEELTVLRLREGFLCGKDDPAELSG